MFLRRLPNGFPSEPTVSQTPTNLISIGMQYRTIHRSSRFSYVLGPSVSSVLIVLSVLRRYRAYSCSMDNGAPDFKTPHFEIRPERLRAAYAPRLNPKMKSSSP